MCRPRREFRAESFALEGACCWRIYPIFMFVRLLVSKAS